MLDGRGIPGATSRSVSDSCPFRSGTVKDFGVVGSDEIILLKCFEGGSKCKISGFVSNPKT